MLEQETDLEPIEIMTDTAAHADMVFGLFWLLGYQFSPRLADIGDARFWRIDRNADYGVLNGLARHRVNIEIIRRNWDDLLRLAGSLKLGRIHAGAIMRVLQVKDRPTTLAKALAELGRIVKTLHMLGYIDSEETRRRVCHGNRGEIRKVYRQEQEEQLGALGLNPQRDRPVELYLHPGSARPARQRRMEHQPPRHRQDLSTRPQAHQLPRPICLPPARGGRRGRPSPAPQP